VPDLAAPKVIILGASLVFGPGIDEAGKNILNKKIMYIYLDNCI
jgi:hypothetical protein